MHKIITIRGTPPDSSAVGTGSSNGYHHHNHNHHYHHNNPNSHKRLSSSSSSTGIRNGGYHHRENGPLLHENNSDSEDGVTEVNQLRNRVRSSKKKRMDWRKVVACILGLFIPVIFPTVHMYIFRQLWGHLKSPVDRKQCSCSCWDTVFKGPYESGVAGYKHVYFNSDGNTLKMWIITVMGVLFLYEAFKRLFFLLLHKRLRWTMAVLFLSSLHSHYYGWWGHWNYWNDDFYQMWYHQVFFTVTELISSFLVLNYLDIRRAIEPIPMFIVCSIAVFHTFCSGWDQFIFTVVQGQGQLHQILRDVTLMVTDIVHATLSFHEIRIYAARKGSPLLSLLIHRNHIAIVLIISVLMYVCVLLFP